MYRTPLQAAKRLVALKETVYMRREAEFRRAQAAYRMEIEQARKVYEKMLLEEGASPTGK